MDKISIPVTGIGDTLKVLHLTDTHITHGGGPDDEFAEFAQRMDTAYAENRHYMTGETVTSEECFTKALASGAESKVDLFALTGDIVNNPAPASVGWVVDALDGSGIDHLYTAGNHDWHYEGIEGSDDEQRTTWRKERLLPLYPSDVARASPDAYAVRFHGLQFVVIDNSTYQVNEPQAAFFKTAVASGLPTVLLLHMPICVRGLSSIACGHPAWGAANDKNFRIERRQRWPETGNSESTKSFVRCVAEATSLVAILSGHLHVFRTDPVAPQLYPELTHPSASQFITRAGAHGGGTLFTFAPLTPA